MPSTRRTFLGSVGGGVSVALAGCAGVGETGRTDGTADTSATADTDDPTGENTAVAGENTAVAGDTERLALQSVVTSGDLPTGEVPLVRPDRISLVNVFTTWCEPCKAEMPEFRRLRDEYDESTLHMVSVSPEPDEAAIEAFWERYDGTWPVVIDESLAATQRWDATSYPTNLLFDRGEPAGADGPETGARSFAEFDSEIDRLLEDG